eukprot:TRINITY_DN55971_c0_g1_i1.p1 TRINITY_DN55971_c0_g1~~TRINITY_DN55971_c0_g1_i1.p1  ORF type:complete len:434 (-),score=56.92 TRINITY_DN55971_c0_g1_i1:194-1495(-)
MNDEPILIVGAGIAGLSCGIGLLQCPLLRDRVIILEADPSPDFRLQGFHYHFNEDSNLDRCLHAIGLHNEVNALKITNEKFCIGVTDAKGRKLLSWDERNPKAIGDISRGELRALLRQRYSELGGIVRFGVKLASVEMTDASAVAHLADGSKLVASLIVGADGVYSRVRNVVLGGKFLSVQPHIVRARGRCKDRGQLEGWTRGLHIRFLVVAHRSGSAFFFSFYRSTIVWVAILQGMRSAADEKHRFERKQMLDLIRDQGNWHPTICELVAEAEEFNAEESADVDMPRCLERLERAPMQRTVLISDALHAIGGGGGPWAICDGVRVAAEIVQSMRRGTPEPGATLELLDILSAKDIDPKSDISEVLPVLREFELEEARIAMNLARTRTRFWPLLRLGTIVMDVVLAVMPTWLVNKPLKFIATRILGLKAVHYC